MMSNLKILITKLSKITKNALESSANFCISQQNYEIEIEHFLYELIKSNNNNDIKILSNKYKISLPLLVEDLNKTISELPKGNSRTPIFAKSIVKLLEQAWLLASAEHNPSIRSSHLLIALLTAPDLYQHAIRASKIFDLYPIDTIKHKYLELCKASEEHESETNLKDEISIDSALNSNTSELQTPALNQYTINLTEKAKNGGIDPVIGREFEIRLMIDILMRRRQNNPILTGEPGVGKTAVVEGLALKIAAEQVPESLKNVQLHVLDMGLLQAGASVKGEFENRLKQVIKEVQSSLQPIIIFIDEAHTLIGAGGQAGQNDAANLLKPALARGELRTIAATTWAEYKQYFEKDAALSRRFQVVKVEEPTEEVAIDMLRAMHPIMQKHFNLLIDDEAIVTAVQSSHRYISGRQLPDKAISVLDTASARVALTQNAQPVKLDQLQAQRHNLNLEIQILRNEHLNQTLHQSRLKDLAEKLDELNTEILATEQQWQKELETIHQIKALEQQDLTENTENSMQVSTLRDQLKQLQGSIPLVFERVSAQMINEIISDWTGIPVGKMQNDQIKQILNLKNKLAERIMGQDTALEHIVQGIKTSRAKLEDPNKPQGVFFLVGPSGVGKTETALALSQELYGGESHLITVNMSEYQEAHTVSSLKGAPPGYVGYGQGGVLTEAVRRNPYSVVLLDEIEKAHSDVQELFYQVFDKGMLEDGEGRVIDFKNTIILLTSNAGSSSIMQACLNQPLEEWPDHNAILDVIKPHLYKQFKPAFLGRMQVVPYFPLHDDLLAQIIEYKLAKIIQRIKTQYAIDIHYQSDLIELILSRCTEVDSGARNIDHILNSSVLPALATKILVALSEQQLPKIIQIDIQDDEMIFVLDPSEQKVKKTENNKTTKKTKDNAKNPAELETEQ
ncbi:type VI secretion system ATPase TssH [Acinetobacter gerneri]|uniref:type VI secretion system ATPase TssH n=1 Tax=Acinetobacter gerneri TaxID=202952 RepID=UPI002935E0CA|nr:type VI secretion system ATPase TssH [Acinetobacter gerneri]MDV2442018.1 type VI secretion system ATPase TssH [Acinetobacter gerneri]